MNEELASLAQRHLRGMSEKTTKARVLRAVDEDTGVWGGAGGWVGVIKGGRLDA